jgi:O-antigen/teichoic acid export membrane protein
MTERPLNRAGSALFWRAVQMVGVKAIFLVRLLILARLLTPDDFGLLAIAVTAVGFLIGITDVGMIPALVQGQEIEEKHYNAAWTVGVTRALLITGTVMIAAPWIAQLFAEPRAVIIIRVLALKPLLDALASIKVADLNRYLQFGPLATIKLAEALANAIVSIILALSFGVWALVAGILAGSMTNLVMSYIIVPHRPRFSFDRSAIRPLIQFGRWIFLTSLVILAGNYVLRVVVSRQLGAAELGLYFLAFQLAWMPTEVASEVIGNVAFPLFARIQSDTRQVAQVFRTVLVGMAALLIPASMLIIALAPAIVQDLLGPQWEGSAAIIRVLTLSGMIGLFGEVAVPVLKGLGRPQLVTIMEVVQSVLLIAFVWLLTDRYGLIGAAMAWLPAIIVSMFVAYLYVRKLLPRPFTGSLPPVAAITLVAVVAGIAALFTVNYMGGLIGIIVASLVAAIIIATMLFLADRYFSLGLLSDFIRLFPQLARYTNFARAIRQ